MSKKKEERQLQIRQILEEKEKIKVAELAKLRQNSKFFCRNICRIKSTKT